MSLLRGGIFRVDFGPHRSDYEFAGHQFALVISEGPATWRTVTVAPVTPAIEPAAMRPRVSFSGRSGFVALDHMRSVDVTYIDDVVVGFLDRWNMMLVEDAILDYLLLTPPMPRANR